MKINNRFLNSFLVLLTLTTSFSTFASGLGELVAHFGMNSTKMGRSYGDKIPELRFAIHKKARSIVNGSESNTLSDGSIFFLDNYTLKIIPNPRVLRNSISFDPPGLSSFAKAYAGTLDAKQASDLQHALSTPLKESKEVLLIGKAEFQTIVLRQDSPGILSQVYRISPLNGEVITAQIKLMGSEFNLRRLDETRVEIEMSHLVNGNKRPVITSQVFEIPIGDRLTKFEVANNGNVTAVITPFEGKIERKIFSLSPPSTEAIKLSHQPMQARNIR